ncbi:MAG: hypothetical protein KAW12_00545, partial [Candidatus Aminicenantes bacterium]|nr:hypothetical protein [Candidatus Aminicenantes bacterium]
LGLSGEDVLVSITKKGFQFSYTRTFPGNTEYSFNAGFDSLTNMSGGGSGKIGIKQKLDFGKLGSTKVDLQVSGDFLLSLKGKIARATFQGAFRFQGQDFSIAKFDLQTDASPLKDFVVILAKKVLAEIRAFLAGADQWLKWVDKGIMELAQGAAQVGDALKNVYKLSSDAIASKTKAILKYGANQTAQALNGAKYASGTAVKSLKKAGYAAYDTGMALKNTFKSGVDDAAKLLKSAGFNADQVGSALKSTFTNSASAAAKALKNAGFNADQVGSALKGTFTDSAEAAGEALKAAGYTAEQTAKVMKKTYGASAKAVSSYMKKGYNLSGKAAEGVLKGAGYTSSQVNDALKSVFNYSPHVKVPHVKHVKVPHVKSHVKAHVKKSHVKIGKKKKKKKKKKRKGKG